MTLCLRRNSYPSVSGRTWKSTTILDYSACGLSAVAHRTSGHVQPTVTRASDVSRSSDELEEANIAIQLRCSLYIHATRLTPLAWLYLSRGAAFITVCTLLQYVVRRHRELSATDIACAHFACPVPSVINSNEE